MGKQPTRTIKAVKKYEIRTNGKPIEVQLAVEVSRPSKVRIIVVNPKKKGAVYLDRWNTVKKKGEFQLRLPKSSEKVLLIVKSENGTPLKVTKLTKTKLSQYIPCVSGSRKIKEFVRFAQDFSENASILSTGTYFSESKRFRIDYMKDIVDQGKNLNTPARISNKTGRMEISKNKFSEYTVPMRMAILLHEFAHFNMNVVQKDETEADLNALKVYLGLGYPVIEAHKAFLTVFEKMPSEENKKRYKQLKTFIDTFEQRKYILCLP